jgi:succinyl-CoA synthetase beta subunit
MASTEGGMDIEAVAARTPEKILKQFVDPVAGLQGYQCRELAFSLGLVDKQVTAFGQILLGLYKLFMERDLSLVEINPLVVTDQGGLLALDGKVNVDDNALYRQKAVAAMRDSTQEDAKETRAREHDLNYIALDGSIGCMVNGAGLAMATMDLIKLHGGMPANFLDVGGGTTKERVAEAFKLILSDPNVKAILVNIFGGIVRCDLIAEGIISAVREVGIKIPVVVRLEGTNVEQGRTLLKESGLAIAAAESLTEAAQQAVAAVN